MIARRISLALANEDTIAANRFVRKFIAVGKEKYSSSDADLGGSLGKIYSEENNKLFIDKAEEYYRSSLKLEPENPLRMSHLAWLFIDNSKLIF